MSRLGRAFHALSDDPGIVAHRTWRDAGLVLLMAFLAILGIVGWLSAAMGEVL